MTINDTPPKISVVMSIYNEPENWMREAIESILNQEYKDYEFIIINDNPEREDNKKIIEQYQTSDNRIIPIHNEINLGLTKSLNLGLEIAKGEYIARIDADDISLPKRFDKQLKYMEANTACVVCGTQVEYIGKSNRKKLPWIRTTNEELKSTLIWGNVFVHSTVIIRRSVLIEYNIQYDTNFSQSQDYRMWTALYNKGQFHNLQEILGYYRKSNTQISTAHSTKQKKFAQKIRRILVKEISSAINYKINLPEKIEFPFIRNTYKNLKNRGLINKPLIYLLQVLTISSSPKKLNNYLWVLFISFKHGILKDYRATYRLLKGYFNEDKLI